MNRLARFLTALLISGVVAGFVVHAGPNAPPTPPVSPLASPDPAAKGHVVRVYYFHTTQRCASCKKIEALSAEAIRLGFERELGDGTLEWQVVNVDDPQNRHFTGDYRLYTKSLIVVDRVNDQQVRWKNLPKVWELLQDETAFRNYVQTEVRAYMENRS